MDDGGGRGEAAQPVQIYNQGPAGAVDAVKSIFPLVDVTPKGEAEA